ncbi:MAG: YihY family inner membrane protein [Oceanospirillaceae bacterium]|nr:YihY family inner membrane protein [Oceanospirillaceae bacterium]MCP5334177.1 YihY family inner membrane protein [Oceanospirillaceae bacterium]MCP5351465.1 YihY family inner membrane protein [Oceanospirillaceae bacterium]
MAVIKAIYRFCVYLLQRFEKNDNRKNAASLTFMTLFAIVPMMTVGFTVLKAFPQASAVAAEIQDFIFQHFAPATGMNIKTYLVSFSHQAKNLTWIGGVFLLFTALTLMLTIEDAFNRVWRVTKKRNGVTRILVYWSVISLGPLVITVGFLLSSELVSYTSAAFHGSKIKQHILPWLPFVLSSLGLTFLYTYVPNCKINKWHAFFGGLLAAALFEAGKHFFVWQVTAFPSYRLVYGAFAVVPLFLLWVYIAWCIVLLGAEFVRALSFQHEDQNISKEGNDAEWALELLRLISQAQFDGSPLSRMELSQQLGLRDADHWEAVLGRLQTAGWITTDGDDAYLLLKDMQRETLANLMVLFEVEGLNKLSVTWQGAPWYGELAGRFGQLQAHYQDLLNIPIYKLINVAS